MNPSIKFSREEGQNNQLLFFDVLAQRHGDGKINTSVFRKSSNSDIVLHYSSNHPMSHKPLCVKTLFDRAQLYCSEGKTLALEHSYLFNMFRSCGYPLSFIRRAMRRKIPRGHGQRENLTPKGTVGGPEDQSRQWTTMGNPTSTVSPRH